VNISQPKLRSEKFDDGDGNDNNNNNKLIAHKHFILEFTINDTYYGPQTQYTPSTDRVPVAHISSLTLHMSHRIQNATIKTHFAFPPFAGTPEFSCASQTKVWGGGLRSGDSGRYNCRQPRPNH